MTGPASKRSGRRPGDRINYLVKCYAATKWWCQGCHVLWVCVAPPTPHLPAGRFRSLPTPPLVAARMALRVAVCSPSVPCRTWGLRCPLRRCGRASHWSAAWCVGCKWTCWERGSRLRHPLPARPRNRNIAGRIPTCNAWTVTQLVTRVDDNLIAEVDQLIAAGVVASRSEAVRLGLLRLIDRHRRDQVGAQIVASYLERPQDEHDIAWADESSARMIAEEPW